MNNLERQPDNGSFEKLEADFGLLNPALKSLDCVESVQTEDGYLRSREIKSDFGLLTISEFATNERVLYTAILTDRNNTERGFGFVDGNISKFIGYSPYTSNQEIKRFLTGFGEEFEAHLQGQNRV